MDLTVLKKKISSYRTPKGSITSLPDELLGEILHAWEQWTGPNSGFYTAIGTNNKKMASIIGRAKKLKREGAFEGHDFAEVSLIDHNVSSASIPQELINGIEVVWDNQCIIRFSDLKTLIEFLKHEGNSKAIKEAA